MKAVLRHVSRIDCRDRVDTLLIGGVIFLESFLAHTLFGALQKGRITRVREFSFLALLVRHVFKGDVRVVEERKRRMKALQRLRAFREQFLFRLGENVRLLAENSLQIPVPCRETLVRDERLQGRFGESGEFGLEKGVFGREPHIHREHPLPTPLRGRVLGVLVQSHVRETVQGLDFQRQRVALLEQFQQGVRVAELAPILAEVAHATRNRRESRFKRRFVRDDCGQVPFILLFDLRSDFQG